MKLLLRESRHYYSQGDRLEMASSRISERAAIFDMAGEPLWDICLLTEKDYRDHARDTQLNMTVYKSGFLPWNKAQEFSPQILKAYHINGETVTT
jgi:hypothetical protein